MIIKSPGNIAGKNFDISGTSAKRMTLRVGGNVDASGNRNPHMIPADLNRNVGEPLFKDKDEQGKEIYEPKMMMYEGVLPTGLSKDNSKSYAPGIVGFQELDDVKEGSHKVRVHKIVETLTGPTVKPIYKILIGDLKSSKPEHGGLVYGFSNDHENAMPIEGLGYDMEITPFRRKRYNSDGSVADGDMYEYTDKRTNEKKVVPAYYTSFKVLVQRKLEGDEIPVEKAVKVVDTNKEEREQYEALLRKRRGSK